MGLNSSYRTYFKSLANSHADLGAGQSDNHFALVSFFQFNDAIRSKISWPCLVAEPADMKIDGPNESQTMDNFTGAIAIYQKVSARNDTPEQKDDKADEALTILKEVLSKMKADAQSGTAHYLLRKFEIRTSSILKIEENDYVGYRVEFTFGYNYNYKPDPNKWL